MTQGKIDPDEAARILREYLVSGTGQRKLAATMAVPLRAMRNYASVGRKVFTIEPIPCESCKRTDFEKGARKGCPECTARSVMET